MEIHICRNEDMHPYECYGSPCIHCDRRKTDDHDPETCALCNFDKDVDE